MKVGLLKALEFKLRVAERIRSELTEREAREARKDPHAKREPRPCGLTVHTGVGCSFACVYCYVPDMGIPMSPKPYKLSGTQLAYAVAINPYTVLGETGTYLAFGSVTEPFLEETTDRTLEYMSAVNRFLKNPMQASTKAYIDKSLASKIREIDQSISLLVSITTLRRKLEPGAPPPEARFETIRNLSSEGLNVTLFMRPVIPGISEEDGPKILQAAREFTDTVIIGGLRVTEGILKRLNFAGVSTEEIESRALRKVSGREQVPVRVDDVKRFLIRVAKELGFKVLPSACAANSLAHRIPCHMCNMGPCYPGLPEFDVDEVPLLGNALGFKVTKVYLKGPRIKVLGKGSKKAAKRLRHFLSTVTRRMVTVKIS